MGALRMVAPSVHGGRGSRRKWTQRGIFAPVPSWVRRARVAPSWLSSTTSRTPPSRRSSWPRSFPLLHRLIVGNRDGRGDLWWGSRARSPRSWWRRLPVLGGIADHAGARKPFFVSFTGRGGGTALLATVAQECRPGICAGRRGMVARVCRRLLQLYLPRIAASAVVGRISAWAPWLRGFGGRLAIAYVRGCAGARPASSPPPPSSQLCLPPSSCCPPTGTGLSPSRAVARG